MNTPIEELNIKEAFEHFMSKAYPKADKYSSQYKESKNIFYAAVQWTFTKVVTISERNSEDEAFKKLEDLKLELQIFLDKFIETNINPRN